MVANSEMLRDASNLFRPKYTMRIGRDIGNVISKFDGWYDKVKQKVRGNRLDDLFDQIEVSVNEFYNLNPLSGNHPIS